MNRLFYFPIGCLCVCFGLVSALEASVSVRGTAAPLRETAVPSRQVATPDSLRLSADTLLSPRDPGEPPEIRLNDTYRKAIESGRFLPAEPGSLSLPLGECFGPAGGTGSLQAASPRLPLAVDFSEYLRDDPFLSDTLRRLADSATLTPEVFMLQNFTPKLARAIRKEAYTPTSLPKWDKGIQIGKLPIYMKVNAGSLFLDEVRDGQRRGSINLTIGIEFSAEELLEMIFWKSARNKIRNRKRENTWKYYNDYP